MFGHMFAFENRASSPRSDKLRGWRPADNAGRKVTMLTTLKAALLVIVSAVALAGGGSPTWAAADSGDKSPKKKQQNENPSAADAKDPKKAGQRVDMKVTDKGFEPANLTVKKGEPVTLVITRITDRTCATEIVIDDYGIKSALPLNKAVEVSFTPKKAGQLKYGCAMNKMVGGVLTIQ
jgi:plastocyanin